MSEILIVSEHVTVDLSAKEHRLKVQVSVKGDETGICNPSSDSMWYQNPMKFKVCTIGPKMIGVFLLFASHYVSIIKLCQNDVRSLDSFTHCFQKYAKKWSSLVIVSSVFATTLCDYNGPKSRKRIEMHIYHSFVQACYIETNEKRTPVCKSRFFAI